MVVAVISGIFPGSPVLLRVRVHLVGSAPEVWRLIEVDGDVRLDEFHEVLQIVMGWQDCHLHDFEDTDPFVRWSPKVGSEPRRWGPAFLGEEDEDILAEEDFTLRQVLSEADPLFYTYDFGDRWVHSIALIETILKSPSDPSALVVRGEGRCPLEDSGGIDGYQELLTVLKDTSHEEHTELADWVTGMTGSSAASYDPTVFDVDDANEKLRVLTG